MNCLNDIISHSRRCSVCVASKPVQEGRRLPLNKGQWCLQNLPPDESPSKHFCLSDFSHFNSFPPQMKLVNRPPAGQEPAALPRGSVLGPRQLSPPPCDGDQCHHPHRGEGGHQTVLGQGKYRIHGNTFYYCYKYLSNIFKGISQLDIF